LTLIKAKQDGRFVSNYMVEIYIQGASRHEEMDCKKFKQISGKPPTMYRRNHLQEKGKQENQKSYTRKNPL
jgi:hypothetical protein